MLVVRLPSASVCPPPILESLRADQSPRNMTSSSARTSWTYLDGGLIDQPAHVTACARRRAFNINAADAAAAAPA